jgi:hypothetical protein
VDPLANLVDGHALLMHLSRVQRDVLADPSGGGVGISEAKQIVVVAVVLHASAEAWKLFEHFGDVCRSLVGVAGLSFKQ